MADQETKDTSKTKTWIKFSEEELKSLQDLQNSYQTKQLQFGQLEVQRLLVTQQLDALDSAKAKLEVEYGGVQETERKLVADLNEKYGPGNLDPATGVFTPAPVAEETSETT
jgi:hypothetical protein